MERSVRKRKSLDAFSIELRELKELCTRLNREFDDSNEVITKIEMKFNTGKFVFDSVEEIMKCSEIEEVSTNFSVRMFNGNQHFHLDDPKIPVSRIYASASSDSEAWCAGIIEVTQSYLKSKRVWYYWLIRWYVWWPMIMVAYSMIFALAYYNLPSRLNWLALILIFVLSPMGSFWRNWFHLYPARIEIRKKPFDIKSIRHIFAIIAAIVVTISAVVNILRNF